MTSKRMPVHRTKCLYRYLTIQTGAGHESLYADDTFYTQPAKTNTAVIDTAEDNGVRSYIFIPSIVYGEGEGFGNRISIQDVAIVKAAQGVRHVYKFDNNDPVLCPIFHISVCIEANLSTISLGPFVTSLIRFLSTYKSCDISFKEITLDTVGMGISWQHLEACLGMISTLHLQRLWKSAVLWMIQT